MRVSVMLCTPDMRRHAVERNAQRSGVGWRHPSLVIPG
jgi:hypothetical protein